KSIGTGAIKISQAATVAKTLAVAIVSKPTGVNLTQFGFDANRPDNKADELGELAAYMLSAIATNADFLAKGADKTVIAILKSIVGAATTKAKGVTPLDAASLLQVAKYVGGSVGLTVQNASFPVAIKAAVTAALTNTKNTDPIAKSLKIDP